jgi:hypothetical protein
MVDFNELSEDVEEKIENQEERQQNALEFGAMMTRNNPSSIESSLENGYPVNADISLRDREELIEFVEENSIDEEIASDIANKVYEGKEEFGSSKTPKDHAIGAILGDLVGDDELKREAGEGMFESYSGPDPNILETVAERNLSESFEARNDSADLDPVAGFAHRKIAKNLSKDTVDSTVDALKMATSIDLQERLGKDFEKEAAIKYAVTLFEENDAGISSGNKAEALERNLNTSGADVNPDEIYQDPEVKEAAAQSIEAHLSTDGRHNESPNLSYAMSEAEAVGIEGEYSQEFAESAGRAMEESLEKGIYRGAAQELARAAEYLESEGILDPVESMVDVVVRAVEEKDEEAVSDVYKITKRGVKAGFGEEFVKETYESVAETVGETENELVEAVERAYEHAS